MTCKSQHALGIISRRTDGESTRLGPLFEVDPTRLELVTSAMREW